MFGFGRGKSEKSLQQTVEEAVRHVMEEVTESAETALGAITTRAKLENDIVMLRKELTDMELDRSRQREEWGRREREVEHKVGLERQRQKFETEQAKREAIVEVREKNLDADRKRFEEQMKFHQDRFEAEVKYLHDMMGKVLERLPDASIIARVGSPEKVTYSNK